MQVLLMAVSSLRRLRSVLTHGSRLSGWYLRAQQLVQSSAVACVDCGRASRVTKGLQFGPHTEGGLPPLTRYL